MYEKRVYTINSLMIQYVYGLLVKLDDHYNLWSQDFPSLVVVS